MRKKTKVELATGYRRLTIELTPESIEDAKELKPVNEKLMPFYRKVFETGLIALKNKK